MSKEKLSDYISKIKSLDADAMAQARAMLNSLANPPGSLGRLEDIAVTLAGIRAIKYQI